MSGTKTTKTTPLIEPPNTNPTVHITTTSTDTEINEKDVEKEAGENEAVEKEDADIKFTHLDVFSHALGSGIYGWVTWLLMSHFIWPYFIKSGPPTIGPVQMGMNYFFGTLALFYVYKYRCHGCGWYFRCKCGTEKGSEEEGLDEKKVGGSESVKEG